MAKKATTAVKKTTVKSTKKTAPKSTTDEAKTKLLETIKVYGAKIEKEIIKYGYTLNAPDESGKSLQHEMQHNKDVKFIWEEFEKASDALKADKEIVMAVLAQVGFINNFEMISKKLIADKEVVLAAVTQNGYAFVYAAIELQAYRSEE